jgi:hypothetical protein
MTTFIPPLPNSTRPDGSTLCPKCGSILVQRKFWDWNHRKWGEPDRLRCHDCNYRWNEAAMKEGQE